MSKKTIGLSCILVPALLLMLDGRSVYAQSNYFEAPKEVTVLPVILVERDTWDKIPDPYNPGFTLAGTPVTSNITDDYNRAVANMTAHLLVAQKKYEYMLRTINGNQRGTFGISTWNYQTDTSEVLAPETVTEKRAARITPFIIDSLEPDAYFQNSSGGRDDNKMMGEIIDAVPTCVSRFSCPYVFVNMYAFADPAGGTHASGYTTHDSCFLHPGSSGGAPFNRLKNPGLGYVYYSYHAFINANGVAANATQTHTQSTVLHELGHAFRGAGHTDATPSTSCADLLLNDYWSWRRTYCSDDVMASTSANWVFQCEFGDASDPSPVNSRDANGYCVYPLDEPDIANIRGSLIEEHIKTMSYNDGVFPNLYFSRQEDVDCVMYDLTQEACDAKTITEKETTANDREIEGYPGFVVTSSHANGGGDLKEIVGYHENVFVPETAEWDAQRMWYPAGVSANDWIHIDVTFPTAVSLDKIRVMTGIDNFGESFIAKAVKVSNPYVPGGTTINSPNNDQDIAWTDTRTHRNWKISVQAAGTYLVVRGIRFFERNGDELFAPAEPVAKYRIGDELTDNAYYGSSLKNIVGANQTIADTSSEYDSGTMWHSNNVGADTNLYIYLNFPEEIELDRVIVYTGYRNASGGMNHVSEETILNYQKNATTWSKASQQSTGGPNADIQQSSPRKSNFWRIRMTTGTSGYIVVRGIRFFNGGREWFAPLNRPRATTNDGEAYGSSLSNIDRFDVSWPTIPGQNQSYDQTAMWHSPALGDGEADIDIEFDKAVALDSIELYTGYTGFSFRHQAMSATIYYWDNDGSKQYLTQETNPNYLTNGDLDIAFGTVKAKRWSVKLQATSTDYLVLRGITVNGGDHDF